MLSTIIQDITMLLIYFAALVIITMAAGIIIGRSMERTYQNLKRRNLYKAIEADRDNCFKLGRVK